MRARWGLIIVVLAGALIALGLVLGAASQSEEILHSQVDQRDDANARLVAGALVPLTAIPVSLGVILLALALSTTPRCTRWRAALGLGGATYVLVQMIQLGFPNYVVFEESATLTLTLLANNLPGASSILIPIMAVIWGAILWAAHCVRRLLGRSAPDSALSHVAWSAATMPFLIVGIWGPIDILLHLPQGSPDAGGHAVVLGLMVVACGAVVAGYGMQAWNLGVARRDPALADYAREMCYVASRIQWISLASVIVLALAGSFLARVEPERLALGTVWGASLRSHHAFMLLLALLAIPTLFTGRRAQRHVGAQGPRMHARAFLVGMVLSFVFAGAATFFVEGALWPWFAAILPMAIAFGRLHHNAVLATTLLGAYTLWAIGNTISAGFVQATDITIRHGTSPGLLALWRMLGILGAGWVITRMVMQWAPRGRQGIMIALGLAATLGLVAALELPLEAWNITDGPTEAVGLGALPISQDPPVMWVMHTIAALATLGAMFLLARSLRPSWFRAKRRGPSLAAP